ncbi:MAG: hypothetical protein JXR65_02300 [Bacteroidales bacterium]|nr:hypothetical protein [Bacteroidales bacterium]
MYKKNGTEIGTDNKSINLENIGPMHNQILDLYYSHYKFGTKEEVSINEKIAVVDKYFKGKGITPLFSEIVQKDSGILLNIRQLSSSAYTFQKNYEVINSLYQEGKYSEAEYLFIVQFYDAIEPYLSYPDTVISIIKQYQKKLDDANNMLDTEKEQLQCVMAIAKSSREYWSTGNGSFKSGYAVQDELPSWVYRDVGGAGASVVSGVATTAAVFGPWGYFGVILGSAAVASMID